MDFPAKILLKPTELSPTFVPIPQFKKLKLSNCGDKKTDFDKVINVLQGF